MEVQKTVLCRLESCYAVEVAELDGTPWYVAASEAKQPCYAFSVQDTAHRQTLWEQPGGCMNIIQIPDGSEEFLAIQRFYSLYQWEEAQLVWVYRDDAGRFQSKVLTRIPYIHRIDVLRDGEKLYFVGCSVAQHKDTLEDWHTGGRIYVGQLRPETRTLEEIDAGYEKNTGVLIATEFARMGKDVVAVPAVLCKNHGPFTWGKDAHEAVHNAVVLEEVAKMAYRAETINPRVMPAPQELQDKHYYRKHGAGAYYGQGK